MKNKLLKGLLASFALAVSGLANAGLIDSKLYMAGFGSNDYFSYDFDSDSVNVSSGTSVKNGLAWNSIDNVMYGLAGFGNELLTIDPLTGLTISSITMDGGWASGLAFDASTSTLYTAFNSGELRTINVNTGNVTTIGSLGVGGFYDISFDSNFNLFGVNGSGSLFSIDKNTGLATSLFTDITSNLRSSSIGGFTAFAINDLDEFYGLTISGDRIVKLDTLTGTSSIVADMSSYDWDIRGMTFRNSVSVPEPSTIAIFSLGLMGLASRKFKKQA